MLAFYARRKKTVAVTLKTKVGLVLVAVGFAIYAGWYAWVKTRKLVPLNIEVSWSAGQNVHSTFRLNFSGMYLVEIEAEQTIPVEQLHCLMGVEGNATECKGIPPAIAATWMISSEGLAVARGTSAEPHSAPSQMAGITRVIGEFQGKAGQAYSLQVNFSSDGQSLAAAHPRLRVAVASMTYTDLDSEAVLVFSIAFICALFGVTLLGIAFEARHRKSGRGVLNGKQACDAYHKLE